MTERFQNRKQTCNDEFEFNSLCAINFPAMLSPKLINVVRSQYRLDYKGIHGLSHWSRVLVNGLRLGQITGADETVVALFSLFHDACRINDSYDPEHGNRGADLARKYRGQLFEISDKCMKLLSIACQDHTRGFVLGDPTVQTCWDADRLDLWRVSIRPIRNRLCTNAAKQIKTIKACCQAAGQQYFPYQYHWLQETSSFENSMSKT